jgi:predicted nucleic acid-binding protein
MNILVDTSVWIDHFKRRNSDLVSLLESDRVLIHPFIVGELACGTPPEPRKNTLHALEQLKKSHQSTLNEVLQFIENENLFGMGCGLLDLFLLSSVLITPNAALWTYDKRLSKLAQRFTVSFRT